MPVNKVLADVIKRIKYEEGITQAEIATSLGVKSTYLSDMINGRVPLSENISDSILNIYGLSLRENSECLKHDASTTEQTDCIESDTVQDRLISFIKFKGVSVNRFEKDCGLSTGYVRNIRVSIQPDKISSIALKFPDLNTGWLLTGDGEMLKKETAQTKISERFDDIESNTVKSLLKFSETIEMLAKANCEAIGTNKILAESNSELVMQIKAIIPVLTDLIKTSTTQYPAQQTRSDIASDINNKYK